MQPLNPQAALAGVNAFRTKNRLGTVVLDARLTRAAAMQSETQAKRDWIGHDGPDGSLPKDRAARAGYRAKIASENVASGQKSDDRSVVRDFCLIFAPLRATMNQKSSLPQAAKSVSQVLMSDSLHLLHSFASFIKGVFIQSSLVRQEVQQRPQKEDGYLGRHGSC